MGISGLLPLLKSIQVNRHLSEFSGQTLAVDAYVWLHRGVYACATEVATGKKTTKYVEYAMTRVRLLRHFKIQPYIVFDGGPLPAKRGTDSERKRKRDDNLAEAKRLTAQGKHAQAREYYAKCVDVTPEMAYQLIKALRAESVPYVVAPYEADAQLAYLERVGLVDGIITEDSDLLVFGCRNVLFKLDTVACTVVSISRSDFGSLTASDGGISMIGWSDAQFRSMAILSGCDYLPSIPGIGLKTAWSLLRKHKTAEKVIRAVQLEGKKDVPRGYIQSFKLVEKVFLHQRVYDPITERLVHLTDVSLNDVQDTYVGENLDPVLARKVAMGDICPTTLLPMVDINPGFNPRALKPLPFLLNGTDGKVVEKDAGKEKAVSQSILNFFGPRPKSTPQAQCPQSDNSKGITDIGKFSGKRRLSDLMHEDMSARKDRHDENDRPVKRQTITRSKFFDSLPHVIDATDLLAGSPRQPSYIPSPMADSSDIDNGDLYESDIIIQEDGYLSPTHSFTRSGTPDLSSPLRLPKAPRASWGTENDKFSAEVLSSPAAQLVPRDSGIRTNCRMMVEGSNRKEPETECSAIDNEDRGLDLQDAFGDDLTSEIDCSEPDNSFTSRTSSSSGPFTPTDFRASPVDMEEEITDEVEEAETGYEIKASNVANGWVRRWAYEGKSRVPFRGMEATITVEEKRRPRTHIPVRLVGKTPKSSFVFTIKQEGRRRDEDGISSDGGLGPTGSDEVEDTVSSPVGLEFSRLSEMTG